MKQQRPVGPMARRLTTDQEIPGSNPGQVSFLPFLRILQTANPARDTRRFCSLSHQFFASQFLFVAISRAFPPTTLSSCVQRCISATIAVEDTPLVVRTQKQQRRRTKRGVYSHHTPSAFHLTNHAPCPTRIRQRRRQHFVSSH